MTPGELRVLAAAALLGDARGVTLERAELALVVAHSLTAVDAQLEAEGLYRRPPETPLSAAANLALARG